MTAPNYRKLLARNVKALMEVTPELSSHAKLAKQCSTATRKIGARTIGHLVNEDEDAPQPQLDTIVAVSEAFKVTPLDLLDPHFDPKHHRLVKGQSARAALELAGRIRDLPPTELAERISELNPERKDMLFTIFSGEAQAVQQPRKDYQGKKHS